MTKDQGQNKTDIVSEIIENYLNLEKSIVSQLNLKVDNHQLTAGHNREFVWLNLFRQIIPMKFAIKQGVFLIDSKGKVSKEVDIAVFDEQYTPYIFNYQSIQFIPIEAVAIVIQCKSKTVNGKIVDDWVQSIDKLETCKGGIARMATQIITASTKTQKATKPISVLCHIRKKKYNNDNYDLIIRVTKDKLEVNWNERVNTLKKAFKRFNGITEETELNTDKIEKSISCLKVKDNSILSLIFQLNQILMLINNPMLFPHQDYVDMFNKKRIAANSSK